VINKTLFKYLSSVDDVSEKQRNKNVVISREKKMFQLTSIEPQICFFESRNETKSFAIDRKSKKDFNRIFKNRRILVEKKPSLANENEQF